MTRPASPAAVFETFLGATALVLYCMDTLDLTGTDTHRQVVALDGHLKATAARREELAVSPAEANLLRELLDLRNPGTIALAGLTHVLTPERVREAMAVLDGVRSARTYSLSDILGETEGAA